MTRAILELGRAPNWDEARVSWCQLREMAAVIEAELPHAKRA
jgi:hypothetical protein